MLRQLFTRIGGRRTVLAAAFVGTLLSAVLAPSQEAEVKQSHAISGSHHDRALQQSPPVLPVLAAYQRVPEHKITVVDVFEARSVPGEKPRVVAPSAPKLPFAYQGLVKDSGRVKVVLLEDKTIHVVEKGGKIGDDYRLDDITTDRLLITYLPLSEQQTLMTGASP